MHFCWGCATGAAIRYRGACSSISALLLKARCSPSATRGHAHGRLMPSMWRGRVLRLHEGDRLEVCDGRGNLVTAELRGVTHKKLAYAEALEGVRQARAARSPPNPRHLCVGFDEQRSFLDP